MASRVLWAVAVLMAALALVAGCFNVDVPKGPYVTVADSPRPVAPQDRSRVSSMDKQTLENEVLRLAAENDRLRQEVARLKRENKVLDDRVDSLEDTVKDLRKR